MAARIKDLPALTGAGISPTDDFVIFDADANVTKRIATEQLAIGLNVSASVVSQAWAENPEDVPVEPNKYSALHHAAKAQNYANIASAAAGFFDRKSLTDLLADTTFTYTVGQNETVAAGDIIRTREEGFPFEVAASGATDHHYTTAGGVKLYGLDQTSYTDTLALRKPRKLWAKIFAMRAAVGQLVWMSAGDSLASRKFVQFSDTLDRALGARNFSPGNPTGNNVSTYAGDQLFETDLVSVTAVTNGYAIVPTGVYSQIAAGGSLKYVAGGVNPLYTKVKVYYIREPGAGTIALSVAGSVVDSASAANATIQLGILEHTVGAVSTQNLTTIAVTGAPVKIFAALRISEDRRGLIKVPFLAAGGITPAQMLQTADAKRIHEQFLQDVQPDIISLEMDDAFADGGANQAALAEVLDLWDATIPTVDKLLMGSTPRASGDIVKLRANLQLRREAKARGPAYLYFDSYTLMGNYADMVAIFGADDGVHPNVAGSAFAAEMLWGYLGLNNTNLLYTPRAVISEDRPSSFFRGTEFRSAVDTLQFQTDATFGYDWDIITNRSLNYKDKNGTVVARLSSNTATFKNVMPSEVYLGSDTSGRFWQVDLSVYDNEFRLRDTANATGYFRLRAQEYTTQSVTLANLPAANVRPGTIRYCSDGRADGQGCFVYSDGNFYWKRVADDIQILPGNSPGDVTDSAASIASVGAQVNTTRKYAGKQVWDTTNNRMMRANGSAAADPWYVIDGSASVTPS